MGSQRSAMRKIARARRDGERLKPNGKAMYKELGGNMLMIGYANERDPLVYYLKSDQENLFNYYRLTGDDNDLERYAWDVRRHEPSHEFDHGRSPIDIIAKALKDICQREITPEEFYQKPSPLVLAQDETHGPVVPKEKVNDDDDEERGLRESNVEAPIALQND